MQRPGRGRAGDQTPWRGSSGVEQAAGAPAPRDRIIQGQVAADVTYWINRSRTKIRRSQNKKEQPNPHNSSGWVKEGWRPGQKQLGQIKQQEPPPPRLHHPGTSGGGRPGMEHPGRIKQQEPAPPGLEH